MTANHWQFVAAAYIVFAVVLTWDYLSPRLRLRRVLRAIALRAKRQAAKSSTVQSVSELT